MLYNIVMFVLVCTITYFLKKLFSKEPNYIKFQSKFFIYYFLTSVAAFVMLPVFIWNPKDVKNLKLVCRVLKHITKIYDLKWELRNSHIVAEDRGAIIISNHQSSLDILGWAACDIFQSLCPPVDILRLFYYFFLNMLGIVGIIIVKRRREVCNSWLMHYFSGLGQERQFNIWGIVDKMTVIAKKELFYVWPFGLSAYLGGVVFINRQNAKQAYKQMRDVSDIMIKKKTKIWVFPEGTRNQNYNTKLLPFKKGAFITAVTAQVPIIPTVFSPYYFINSKKYIFNKGHVIINCLEPIPTKGLTLDDVPDLMKKTYDLMQAEYLKLSKEVLEALPKDYPLIQH